MKKLGFIGVGNMGGAILKGIEGKLGNTAVFAYDANAEKLADLRLVGATAAGSAREIAEKCDFILLAVKPQHLGEVLAEIKDSVKPETVFISICAGISAEFIRERTIPNAKVVLVMPNTPMMLGCGASAMSHDETVSEDEFAFARKVIGSCGITEVIPTDKMKEIIAVNGSSPAFIYLYAKGFVDYADSVGIDKDVALRLFAQSLIGSAKMLTESGMTVDELIKQVSSPGGTTLAGLDKLYEGDLTGDVKNACDKHSAFLASLNAIPYIDVVIGKLTRVPIDSKIPIDKNNPATYKHVEKNTDINISNDMLLSTADIVVLLSVDSDFENTVNLIKSKGKKVLLVVPIGAKSSQMQQIVGRENIIFLDKAFFDNCSAHKV